MVRLLESLAADMRLTLAKIESAQHAMTAMQAAPPSAQIALPDRCEGVDATRCALRDGEWSTHGRSFAHPSFVTCTGCGHKSEGGPEG